MIGSAPFRYALRKEHFGGLLLDYETSTYKIYGYKEYQFLEHLLTSKKDFNVKYFNDKKLKEQLKSSIRNGLIEIEKNGRLRIVNTRLIPTPLEVPINCLSAPIIVYDTYTRKCNLNCRHCYSLSDSTFSERRRTLEQTEIVMKKFYETGTLEWRFTGGEPTIIPDLPEAISIAKKIGLKVSLNTNGYWSQKKAEKIHDSGVDEIVVSIEGREKTNDHRRYPGSFKRVIHTLESIANHNQKNPDSSIKVVLNMTIGRDNISDLDFVIKLGAVYKFNVNFVPLKPSGRASKNLQAFMLSTEEYSRFAENVQRLREETYIRDSGIKVVLKHKDLFCPDYPDKSHLPYPFNYSECQALTTGLGLFSDGRVLACPFLMNNKEFIGPNVVNVSVYEAWLAPAMQRFRGPKKADCIDCRFYKERCRGKCRASVLLNGGRIADGTLIGKDPYCFKELIEN